MSNNFELDLSPLEDFYTEPSNQQALQAASYAARVLLLPSSADYMMIECVGDDLQPTFGGDGGERDQECVLIAKHQLADHIGRLAAISVLNSEFNADQRPNSRAIIRQLIPRWATWQTAKPSLNIIGAKVQAVSLRNLHGFGAYTLAENTQVTIDREWHQLHLTTTEVDGQVVTAEARKQVTLQHAYTAFRHYFQGHDSSRLAWMLMKGSCPPAEIDNIVEQLRTMGSDQVSGCSISRDEAIAVMRDYREKPTQISGATEKLGLPEAEPDLSIVAQMSDLLRPLRALK